jgi:hypothetical protein
MTDEELREAVLKLFRRRPSDSPAPDVAPDRGSGLAADGPPGGVKEASRGEHNAPEATDDVQSLF